MLLTDSRRVERIQNYILFLFAQNRPTVDIILKWQNTIFGGNFKECEKHYPFQNKLKNIIQNSMNNYQHIREAHWLFCPMSTEQVGNINTNDYVINTNEYVWGWYIYNSIIADSWFQQTQINHM